MKVHLLHGKPIERIRKVLGIHGFREYILEITNVPTRKRSYGVGYIIFKNTFPEELWKGTTLALEHYLLQFFYKKSKKEGLSWIDFQRPTSALVPRSGIEFNKEKTKIKIKFHFRIPKKGRDIDGKSLARAFERVFPKLVKEVKNLNEDRYKRILEIKQNLEDQMEVRRFLAENNYLAFIGSGVEINGTRVRVHNPDRIRVPNAGRIEGMLIPEGKTSLSNISLELLEMLSRGYAYYKPEKGYAFVKTIRDLAWISPGEEWLASYGDLRAVLGTEDLDYPNTIILDGCSHPNTVIVYNNGELKKRRLGKGLVTKPSYEEVVMKKKLPKIKLGQEGLLFGETKLGLPYSYSSSIIERNQLRAVVDAINFSQKFVNGKLDIKGVVSRTVNVVNKKGLSILGLGFYTEFTRWQLFYLLYKLTKANP